LRDGSVWIATEADINILRRKGDSTVILGRQLPGHKLTSMLEDHYGAVWIAAENKLMLFQNGRFREVTRRNGQPIASAGDVVAIADDVHHTIWVLTSRGQLLSVVGDSVLERASVNPQLGEPKYLATDLTDGVWIGNVRGAISYYRDGRLQTIPLTDSQGPLDIHNLFVDTDNSVLVSTSQGLYRLKDGQRSDFSSDNGLPCTAVYSAIRDNNDALWIYTRCGLVRVSQTEWAKWVERPHGQVPVAILDALDGAQAGMGSPYQPTSSKAPDGRLWFITGVAAQVINPDNLYDKTPPPPVYVEGLVADHKALQASSSLQIPALTRDLQIDYTALSFSLPQKVRFRYLLEGHDREWQDAGTRRQAFYTDLAPGNYRFRVTACNSHGVWSPAGASFDFAVLPAYYQTTWFHVACACVFLLLCWTLYYLRVRALHRRFEIGLEARVAERTRIARELHDTLLQSFHGSLLRFQAVSNLLPGHPEDARKKLDNAIDRASDTIAEARGAVEGLRSPALVNSDLGIAIRTFGEELAAGEVRDNPPALDVTIEGEARDLDPIVRDEVYRIATEALRNAYQHAGASRVEVQIRYDARQFRLRIRDNGRGINNDVVAKAERTGHYGLHGMSERAKLMGGHLEIWSNVGSGTELELTVPASPAYHTRHSHRRFFGEGA
jgi:signal transduction histidine kinase